MIWAHLSGFQTLAFVQADTGSLHSALEPPQDHGSHIYLVPSVMPFSSSKAAEPCECSSDQIG